MSTLSPPMLHRLDLACTHIAKVFEDCTYGGPYLVGSVQERTSKAGSDVDVRLILIDEHYDSLMAGTPEGFATLLDFALGAYLRELTGLPIDFQVQRMTEANANHAGKQRNPLGCRDMTNWVGDARPEGVRDTDDMMRAELKRWFPEDWMAVERELQERRIRDEVSSDD